MASALIVGLTVKNIQQPAWFWIYFLTFKKPWTKSTTIKFHYVHPKYLKVWKRPMYNTVHLTGNRCKSNLILPRCGYMTSCKHVDIRKHKKVFSSHNRKTTKQILPTWSHGMSAICKLLFSRFFFFFFIICSTINPFVRLTHKNLCLFSANPTLHHKSSII